MLFIRRYVMASKTSETRENQIKLYDQRIKERRADLEKRGISPKEFDKDKVYEHLKAKRRAIMKAIAAINAGKARNERRKEEAVEQPAPAPAASKEKPKKEKPKKTEKTAPPAKAGD
jgi:hypothetical protein